MLKILAGLLEPNSGVARIDGWEIGEKTKAIVSYQPDYISLEKGDRVSELLKLYQSFFADFQAEAEMEMLERFQLDSNARLKSLSKGNQEKVQFILTMCRDAKLYLLDEPISGVDPAMRDSILGIIMERYRPESTVILSTHLISDVEIFLDEVILLQNGVVRLVSSVDEVREKYGKSVDGLFREAFSC